MHVVAKTLEQEILLATLRTDWTPWRTLLTRPAQSADETFVYPAFTVVPNGSIYMQVGIYQFDWDANSEWVGVLRP